MTGRIFPEVSSRNYPDSIGETDPKIGTNPGAVVYKRVQELYEQMPQKVRGWITLAVGAAKSDEEKHHCLLGTSEPSGYLRDGVRPRIDEIVIRCKPCQHAEITVIAFVMQEKWILISIGATRLICDDCRDAIEEVQAEAVTPLKNPRNAGS